MTTAIRSDQIATREDGAGVPVVLLHGSASDGHQWRSLTGWLSGRFRVIACDLPGYGATRRLPGEPTLGSLVEALRPIVGEGQPVHLVGHGFGGAVALKAACMLPGQVRSLTLIEPTVPGLLWNHGGYDIAATRKFLAAVSSSASALAEGDAWEAMRHVVDFWNGEGAWGRTSFGLRQRIAAKAGQTHDDFAAVGSDLITDPDLSGVVCPTLSLRGSGSPAMTAAIAERLKAALPFIRHVEIEGAGHMLPLTDPHVVDPMIGDFLASVDRAWQGACDPAALAA